MPNRQGRNRLRSALKSALDGLVDRVLGPKERLGPEDVCVVNRSVVSEHGGMLLKGTEVSITGIRDRQDRHEVRILSVPDYDWGEMSRLPYGPGFLLFVEEDFLTIRTKMDSDT